MVFKIGSFNVIPSFTVMTLGIAGVGALPWGLRYLMEGEAPRPMDDFEKYKKAQREWESGNPWLANLKSNDLDEPAAKLQ